MKQDLFYQRLRHSR